VSRGRRDDSRDDSPDRQSRRKPSVDTENQNELASQKIEIGRKHYFINVKENDKGRFIKIVEVLKPSYRKNKMSLPMNMLSEFTSKLVECNNKYNTLKKDDPSSSVDETDDGCLHSVFLRNAARRVYLDLKQNKMGMFLRISSANQMNNRTMVVFPAERIQKLIDVLTQFNDDYGETDKPELPAPTMIFAERKQFFLDCGRNDRGEFLQVSEVTPHYRSSVTIPKSGLKDFRDAFEELCKKMEVSDS